MKQEIQVVLNVGIIKKINDRSKYLILNNKNIYTNICSLTYYNGNLYGFLQNINMIKNPIVSFGGTLTYYGLNNGSGNITDTPKFISIDSVGKLVIMPSIVTGFTNGVTCLVQVGLGFDFILDAR